MSEATEKAKPDKTYSLVKKLYAEVVGDKDSAKISELKKKVEEAKAETRLVKDKLKSAQTGTKVKSEIINIAASVTTAKNDGKSLSDMKALRKIIKKIAMSEQEPPRSDLAKLYKISAEVLINMPKPVKEPKPKEKATQSIEA